MDMDHDVKHQIYFDASIITWDLEPCISNNQDKNLGCSQSKDVNIVIFIALKECLCELVVPCT